MSPNKEEYIMIGTNQRRILRLLRGKISDVLINIILF